MATEDLFPTVEPWPTPVDLAVLLDEIVTITKQYLSLPSYASEVIALYSAYTYVFDSFFTCPYLLLTSPEPRCGKTRTLDLLGSFVYRPLPCSNISPSALFRTISQHIPTLIIDEADTFFDGKEELKGILNSGNTKTSAFVIRCDGEANEPKRFSTWACKVFARIGSMWPALEDRSITINMQRKPSTEQLLPWSAENNEALEPIRRKLLRWSVDNLARLSACKPVMPVEQIANDRAVDKWTPLVAIADLAGNHWPTTARRAAIHFAGSPTQTTDIKILLLQDIRTIFEDQDNPEFLPTQALLAYLLATPESPWSTYNRGFPIKDVQLAKHLKAYGIRPCQVKQGTLKVRGYNLQDFQDTWTRYLPRVNHNEINAVPGSLGYANEPEDIKSNENKAVPGSSGKTPLEGIASELVRAHTLPADIEILNVIRAVNNIWAVVSEYPCINSRLHAGLFSDEIPS